MKKFKLIFISFILLSSTSFGKVYTYKELVDLALSNNLEGKISKTKINEIDLSIKIANSDYFPKLSAVIGSERRESKSESDINSNNSVGELRVNYNLYRFGRTDNKIRSLIKLKQEEIKISKYKKDKLIRKLELEYYNSLLFKNKLQIINEEIEFNKTLKSQVSLKKKQGLVGDADVLEIDMRDATLKNEILQIQEEYLHSLDNIRKITLISHDQVVDIEGEIPHQHISINNKKVLNSSFDENIKLSNTLTQIESIKFELDSSKTQKLPEFNLVGRYGKMRIDEQYTNNESTEGLIGIYVNIPIFDGGESNSKVNLIKNKLEREKLYAERKKINLEIDVIHAIEKLENIHKQVDLAEVNVSRAKNYFDNVLKEYKRGIKNSLDLVSARDRLMNFKKDFIIVKRDFMRAKLNLEDISGFEFEIKEQ